MLRRGLVLDLSIAMGKRTEVPSFHTTAEQLRIGKAARSLSEFRDWSEGLEMRRKRRIEANKGLNDRSRNYIRISVVVRYVTRHPFCWTWLAFASA